MNGYVSTKEARKILGVTTATLINWDKTNKINTIKSPYGQRLYSKQDIYTITGIHIPDKKIKKKICYARVSSKKQMDDLKRQEDFFRSKYPDHVLVTDIGSGINWKRKGLKTILEQTMQGEISEIVVAHKDRLCRFAFELIEWIFTKNEVKLIVLNDDESKSENQELADDIISIIHVYSCREYGKRRYNSKNKKIKDISNKEA